MESSEPVCNMIVENSVLLQTSHQVTMIAGIFQGWAMSLHH